MSKRTKRERKAPAPTIQWAPGEGLLRVDPPAGVDPEIRLDHIAFVKRGEKRRAEQ